MSDRSLRILVVDDHPYMRRALRSLLETRRDWVVCGEAADGREAVEISEKLCPDVVIMDMSMPELNGLQATRLIRQFCPSSQVVILTWHHLPDLPRLAREAGAQGLVLKSHSSELLIAAVESVSQSTPFFDSGPS